MKKIEPLESGVDNKFSMLSKAVNVHSTIRNTVTSDFVLSKLSEQEKEGMVELTSDARYAVRIILAQLRETVYEWDKRKSAWIERNLNKEEQDRIKEAASHTFDVYMDRLMMINIVNRNRDDNPLIKYMFEIREEEEVMAEQQNKNFFGKLKEAVTRNDKERQD